MASPTVVVFGLGQIGRVAALGALKAGFFVRSVGRTPEPPLDFDALPAHTPLILATPEDAVSDVVLSIPAERKRDLVFVQNEIFPQTLTALDAPDATVAVFWLLKKPPLPEVAARPVTVAGPHAATMADILAAGEIAARATDVRTCLIDAAQKYAFIVAVNSLGLIGEGTVGSHLRERSDVVDALIREGLAIGHGLVNVTLPDDAFTTVRDALEVFSFMPAKGRTARARVERALSRGRALGLTTEEIRRCYDVV